MHRREDEGQEEVLEDKDEGEEENEVDEKVKEVRENAQLMLRHGDDHGMERDANANILSQSAMRRG